MASSTITIYDERKVTHKWVIKDFDKHLDEFKSTKKIHSLNSSIFPVDRKTHFILNVKLVYGGSIRQNSDSIFLYLKCCEYRKTEMVRCEFYVLDVNNIKCNKVITRYTTTDTDIRDELEFCSIKELLENRAKLLPYNTLTIGCDLAVFNSLINISSICEQNFEYTMESQFRELLNSENNSDFTFQVDDQIIKVHKLILMARSPIFRAMFESEMLEKKYNKTIVKDIHPKIFKIMIEFIYTDKVAEDSLAFDEITELFETADKYQLNHLKHICEKLFFKLINIENAMKILLLAEQYNTEQLIKAVQNFIKANKQEVLKTIDLDYFKTHGHHANIFLF